jgi:hypothetical protein
MKTTASLNDEPARASSTPSMRRPVSVKTVFLFPPYKVSCVRAEPPLSPSFHPHSF